MKNGMKIFLLVNFVILIYGLNAGAIDNVFESLMDEYFWKHYEEMPAYSDSVLAGPEEFDELTLKLSKSNKNYNATTKMSVAVTMFILLLTILFRPLKWLESNSKSRDVILGYVSKSAYMIYNVLTNQKLSSKMDSVELQKVVKEARETEGRKNVEELEEEELTILYKGKDPSVRNLETTDDDDTDRSFWLQVPTVETLTACSLDEGLSCDSSTVSKIAAFRRCLESDESFLKGLRTESSLNEAGYKLYEASSTYSRGDCKLEPADEAKLMERIKMLEEKLRQEEQKNHKWITRMTRAEEVLQQLNKQVEEMETKQAYAAGSMKITSTVIKWMQPKQQKLALFQPNLICLPYHQHKQLILNNNRNSITELIKKEIDVFLPETEDNESCRTACSDQFIYFN